MHQSNRTNDFIALALYKTSASVILIDLYIHIDRLYIPIDKREKELIASNASFKAVWERISSRFEEYVKNWIRILIMPEFLQIKCKTTFSNFFSPYLKNY